ncbi:flagellar biosynthetic protein FliO [Rhizobium sp. S152]|uniref:flagellar biosynthetic protein FliO n=1 Tax=Rhizobium sp. S152 TaxID=3055038 RepID=UPI0025A9BDC9|nr:flagellar biosynthetic protein FliO [Rhizobium sp. S152]MDM9628261.1 flagellar biosynthetic protein FliO [Rhizobium sp. S152]
MFDNLMDGYGSRFLIAAAAVAVGLLLLFIVLWLMRNRASSPFVRGGRNRQPRLQVLDAAAVDARRRLVLVRRDDVEHLIMIGGPTDIVIESRIHPDGEPAPVSAPTPTPAPAPGRSQPVMIAEAEPAAPAKPSTSAAPAVAAITPPPSEAVPVDVRPEPLVRPVPVQAIPPAAARPAPAEPPHAPAVAPPPSVEPRPQVQSFRQTETRPTPAPIETDMAADILDSARQRVLQQPRVEPPLSVPIAPQPAVTAFDAGVASPAPHAPPVQPSDFQRILEDEMNNTLAAERMAPPVHLQSQSRPVPAPSVNQPRRDPEMAPITGPDAALQNEVARIFGEMSVNRDK